MCPRRSRVSRRRARLIGWQNRATLKAMSALRDQIASLSPDQKAELLDEVWESLEGDLLSLTDEQRAELDHRIARHERQPSDVMPWADVRARFSGRVAT